MKNTLACLRQMDLSYLLSELQIEVSRTEGAEYYEYPPLPKIIEVFRQSLSHDYQLASPSGGFDAIKAADNLLATFKTDQITLSESDIPLLHKMDIILELYEKYGVCGTNKVIAQQKFYTGIDAFYLTQFNALIVDHLVEFYHFQTGGLVNAFIKILTAALVEHTNQPAVYRELEELTFRLQECKFGLNEITVSFFQHFKTRIIQLDESTQQKGYLYFLRAAISGRAEPIIETMAKEIVFHRVIPKNLLKTSQLELIPDMLTQFYSDPTDCALFKRALFDYLIQNPCQVWSWQLDLALPQLVAKQQEIYNQFPQNAIDYLKQTNPSEWCSFEGLQKLCASDTNCVYQKLVADLENRYVTAKQKFVEEARLLAMQELDTEVKQATKGICQLFLKLLNSLMQKMYKPTDASPAAIDKFKLGKIANLCQDSHDNNPLEVFNTLALIANQSRLDSYLNLFGISKISSMVQQKSYWLFNLVYENKNRASDMVNRGLPYFSFYRRFIDSPTKLQ